MFSLGTAIPSPDRLQYFCGFPMEHFSAPNFGGSWNVAGLAQAVLTICRSMDYLPPLTRYLYSSSIFTIRVL